MTTTRGARLSTSSTTSEACRKLLQVVEHDQQVAPCQELEGGRAAPGLARQAEHLPDLRPHRLAARRVGQRHEVHPVAKGVDCALGECDRQPRLARAPGARQGHEPRVGPRQEDAELLKVGLPSDQRGGRYRQAAGRAEAPDRGELAVQTLGRRLVEVLRIRQVLESMPAQVHQAGVGG